MDQDPQIKHPGSSIKYRFPSAGGTPAVQGGPMPDLTTQLPAALLLLGPTGAGKTPLGVELEDRGLWGRRCVHFDFGANLRRGAVGQLPDGLLTNDEQRFLVKVIESGALLEDEQFAIAEKIIRAFIQERGVDSNTFVVLNGLPRHAGQATALQPLVAMRAVINMTCDAATVLERIRTNAGGDRVERADDDPDSVRRRLDIYRERTAPLVEFYRNAGVRIIDLPVGVNTTAADLRTALQKQRIAKV
jgi:adenylate kinase